MKAHTKQSQSLPLPLCYRPASLKLNEETSFSHVECGDSKSRLYVKRTRQGWLYHCHNCAPKMSGFMRDEKVWTPSETIRRANAPVALLAAPELRTAKLPADFTDELSVEAFLWLDKYDITDEEAEYYNIGYSSRYNRLVLPIYSPTGLIGWQGRALDGAKPKYMTFIGNTDGKLWFDSRHGIQTTGDATGKYICLVEDIMSAIKVGRQCRSIALLGSYVREELITWMKGVSESRKDIEWIIWLDPDKHTEMHKIAGRLRSLGLMVHTISSTLDPKDYDNFDIAEMLATITDIF